jgi:Plasmid pRiA4b ORF-3-like protein
MLAVSAAKREMIPVRMTYAQRKIVAELLPALAERLLLDTTNQRTLEFPLAELTQIKRALAGAIRDARGGSRPNSLRLIRESVHAAIERYELDKAATASATIYRFKVALMDCHPPIWRQIEVPDGTLDDLHEHIQTAMGWTNSHLHQFIIDDDCYGDPDLLNDGLYEREIRPRPAWTRCSAKPDEERDCAINTTSAIAGSMKLPLRAASRPSLARSIRAASTAPALVRRKMLAEPGAMPTSWKRFRILATKTTRTCSNGSAAASIPRNSAPHQPPKKFAAAFPIGTTIAERPVVLPRSGLVQCALCRSISGVRLFRLSRNGTPARQVAGRTTFFESTFDRLGRPRIFDAGTFPDGGKGGRSGGGIAAVVL